MLRLGGNAMSRLFLCSLALSLSIVDLASAKDPPTAKPSSPATAAAEAAKPDKKPPEATADQEHIIYIPFKNLPDVFDRADSSVVLPYGQLLELWGRQTAEHQQPVKPPVDGVITRADYVGAVKGDIVRLDATLDVEVLGEQWARLPLQFGDTAIGSAQADDDAVLLRGAGEGKYELVVRGKGKHKIKLALAAAVKSGAEGRSVTIQCPAVGVSNLELQIPEKDLAVHVTPQRTVELRTDKDTTAVRAVLGSIDRFTVAWQPKSGATDNATGLASVTDAIAVDVGDGVVHTHAVLDYQILRGSLSELVVEAPADQRLLDVQSPGLRDWRTETAGNSQRVRVRLHAPTTEPTRLELHTESPIPAKAFQVGRIRAVGVARESGTLALRAAEDVSLEPVTRESVTRIDAGDAPAALRKSNSTFYKFFTPDHNLSVVASQLTPRVVVGSRLSVLLDRARLTTRGDFKYRVTRSGVFALTFRLPAGFQVDEVQTDSMERFEVAVAAGSQTLTVHFTKKMLGDLTVTITASQPREKRSELTLPLLEPLSVTREEGLVAVIVPESLEVKTDAGHTQAARAATPAELAAQGFEPRLPAGSTLAAAFSFVTRPVQIVQTVTERPRRTAVAVNTAINVKEDLVQVTTSLRYQIQFAGTDTFRIAVPVAVSDRLQIDGDGIKERRKSPQPTADGDILWTIVLHSEATGPRVFTATYDRRLSLAERGSRVVVRPIKPLDVDRETGEMAVFKDRALSVDAEHKGLEEIDPRELSQPVAAAQPYLTYRYFQHPAELSLSVTKHELQDVVKTVVRHAYIEAVVTEDGPTTVRARYDIKSSERQRLAVTLHDPRILGVTVAGQSVAPEKAPTASGSGPKDKTYFVNVARTADSDEPFQVAMVFETPRADKDMKISDVLRIPLPRFEQGVKFQKVYVRVWMPKQYRLVGDPDGLTSHVGVGLWDSRKVNEAADNPDGWFAKDSTSFDFQVGGTTYLFSSLTDPVELKVGYWHIPTMTAIASLIVLLVGFMLLWFSIEVKVSTVLVAALAVALGGLFVPSHVYSWLLAARMGIAGVIAIWLVAWLLYLRRSGTFTPRPIVQNAAPPAASPS
jgi:hypothetical protein